MQGVGFRPFVYRLAGEYGITGQVQNRLGDVEVIACGEHDVLQRFCGDVVDRAPPLSRVTRTQQQWLADVSYVDFNIVASTAGTTAQIFVPPDYFMCDDCRRELSDAGDRRHGYPFINCTQCGPRYTLIEALPYDRPNTSMADFPLCADCAAEYNNPHDRRFHAEPLACPACGPTLSFLGAQRAASGTALDNAIAELRDGKTVAVKGVGGYHLMCDALSTTAVALLRQRKQRPDKPLAVMFPVSGADGCDRLRRYALLDEVETSLITGPMRPIVLLQKQGSTDLAENIAPDLAEIGAFLPYSPLHQLLLDSLDRPLVATSGNISGEPVLIDNHNAQESLGAVADSFLHHNRRIVRPADDSVFRQVSGRMRPLRLGRGATPLEFELPWPQPRPVLAVGGQMKGSIALSWDKRIVVSPHIGEMDSPRSLHVFERLAEDLQSLYKVRAECIVCDAHPGYTTHRWAHQQQDLAVETVWHHHAHASALTAEHGLRSTSLVFTWDGIGLGEDGTLWGGDALLGRGGSWRRVSRLRPFRLPGGVRAGREPWRSAAALLWETGRSWRDSTDAEQLAKAAWQADLNCPTTTAAGRLFDAAAAIILGLNEVSFEAAGPMQLEALCQRRRDPVSLPLAKCEDGLWQSDWEPLLELLQDQSLSTMTRAEVLHASLAQSIVSQARVIRDESGITEVGLCGGVFQNRVLSEQVIALLREDNFTVFMPERLPCNDAALCVGQAAELAARAEKEQY